MLWYLCCTEKFLVKIFRNSRPTCELQDSILSLNTPKNTPQMLIDTAHKSSSRLVIKELTHKKWVLYGQIAFFIQLIGKSMTFLLSTNNLFLGNTLGISFVMYPYCSSTYTRRQNYAHFFLLFSFLVGICVMETRCNIPIKIYMYGKQSFVILL